MNNGERESGSIIKITHFFLKTWQLLSCSSQTEFNVVSSIMIKSFIEFQEKKGKAVMFCEIKLQKTIEKSIASGSSLTTEDSKLLKFHAIESFVEGNFLTEIAIK